MKQNLNLNQTLLLIMQGVSILDIFGHYALDEETLEYLYDKYFKKYKFTIVYHQKLSESFIKKHQQDFSNRLMTQILNRQDLSIEFLDINNRSNDQLSLMICGINGPKILTKEFIDNYKDIIRYQFWESAYTNLNLSPNIKQYIKINILNKYYYINY